MWPWKLPLTWLSFDHGPRWMTCHGPGCIHGRVPMVKGCDHDSTPMDTNPRHDKRRPWTQRPWGKHPMSITNTVGHWLVLSWYLCPLITVSCPNVCSWTFYMTMVIVTMDTFMDLVVTMKANSHGHLSPWSTLAMAMQSIHYILMVNCCFHGLLVS